MSAGDWLAVVAGGLGGGLLLIALGVTGTALATGRWSSAGGALVTRHARRVPSEMRAHRGWSALLSRTNAGGRAVSAGRHRAPDTSATVTTPGAADSAGGARPGTRDGHAPATVADHRSARPAPPLPPVRGVVACLGCGREWVAPPGSDPATELVAHQRTHHAGAHRDEEATR